MRRDGCRCIAAGRSRPDAASCSTRADYFIENSTLPIDEHVCLTATLEILKAIAVGNGPENAMLALGYAGWAPGQLESEIQANGWLHCPAAPDLIFDPDLDSKYDRALSLLGVDPAGSPAKPATPRASATRLPRAITSATAGNSEVRRWK